MSYSNPQHVSPFTSVIPPRPFLKLTTPVIKTYANEVANAVNGRRWREPATIAAFFALLVVEVIAVDTAPFSLVHLPSPVSHVTIGGFIVGTVYGYGT